MFEFLKSLFSNPAFYGAFFGSGVTLITMLVSNRHALKLREFDLDAEQREKVRLEKRQAASDTQKLIMNLIRLVQIYPPYQLAEKNCSGLLSSDWDKDGIHQQEVWSLIDEIYVKSFLVLDESIIDDIREIYSVVDPMMNSVCYVPTYSTGLKELYEVSGNLVNKLGDCIRE